MHLSMYRKNWTFKEVPVPHTSRLLTVSRPKAIVVVANSLPLVVLIHSTFTKR